MMQTLRRSITELGQAWVARAFGQNVKTDSLKIAPKNTKSHQKTELLSSRWLLLLLIVVVVVVVGHACIVKQFAYAPRQCGRVANQTYVGKEDYPN
jgi:hypothetical protein